VLSRSFGREASEALRGVKVAAERNTQNISSALRSREVTMISRGGRGRGGGFERTSQQILARFFSQNPSVRNHHHHHPLLVFSSSSSVSSSSSSNSARCSSSSSSLSSSQRGQQRRGVVTTTTKKKEKNDAHHGGDAIGRIPKKKSSNSSVFQNNNNNNNAMMMKMIARSRGFAAAAAKSPEDYPPHSVIPFPSLSPTMTQGGVASWAVSEGAKINAGDILAEIQTDKATMEMECMDDGYLAKILVPAGEADDIPIGRAIAVTCENEEDVGKFADYVAEDTVGNPSVLDSGETSLASAAGEPAAKAILERPEYEAIKKGDLTRNSRAAGRDLDGSKDEDLNGTATASKLPADSPSMTVRDALNSALSEEMTRDEKVFIIGEEVGEYQGAYKITKGLHQKFGAERVRDTPITEAGFTGIACGAAFMGLKPVVEFMTFNFALQSIDHIVNSAAKTLYMSAGTISCPIVFRGPNGAAAGVGAQHSQCFAAWYMSIPGLKVLAPYDAEDARGLMKAAIRDPDPVVFLENELLYGESFQLPKEALDEDFTIEIGKAKIMREGSDVTLVAFSKMVGYCLKAAEELEKEGVRAEVINLRSLRPFDREAVARSAKKNGRVVIVEEGWPQCGVGSEIAACVNEDAFDYLDAPVERVTGVDIPMPYAANLEALALPKPADIVSVAKRTLFRGD